MLLRRSAVPTRLKDRYPRPMGGLTCGANLLSGPRAWTMPKKCYSLERHTTNAHQSSAGQRAHVQNAVLRIDSNRMHAVGAQCLHTVRALAKATRASSTAVRRSRHKSRTGNRATRFARCCGPSCLYNRVCAPPEELRRGTWRTGLNPVPEYRKTAWRNFKASARAPSGYIHLHTTIYIRLVGQRAVARQLRRA